MENPEGNALFRTWPYAKPYLGSLAGSMLLALVMTGLAMTFPPISGAVIDDLSRTVERGGRLVADPDTSRLWFFAILTVCLGAAEAFVAFLRRYIAATGSISMERDMRNALFHRLQRLPISFHDRWQSGQLLSRVTGDLGTIRRFIGFGLIFLVVNTIQFVAVSVMMFLISPTLTAFTVGMAVPIAVLARIMNRRYHRYARAVQDDTGDLATVIEESTTGIRIIKAFGRGRFMIDRFRDQANTLHDSNMRVVKLRALFWPILAWLPAINMAAVVTIGGLSVLNGSMSLGDLNEFILYLIMLAWPIRSVGWILGMAEEARTASERYFEVMDAPLIISDAPNATALPDELEGRVRFESVSFTYPGASDPTLANIDLELEPGETMALVGATGSGKTTLASLVPRLIDPSSGRITIDGHDIRGVRLESLRRAVGVAFEEPVLFSMSARENLILGYPQATTEDIDRAIDIAHAGFLRELPWGLDTRVGEQGYSLSGGQRQRLALARAIISRPSVLVLDDPLSAVDVHTEEQIESALRSVLTGMTALIVVHRPSTVALCDRVALLHDGRITEVGRHHELMANSEVYRNILSMEAEIAGEAAR
ncbi:MAG: ABC transporter ATP-binding protein [Actinomycetota bacterium]